MSMKSGMSANVRIALAATIGGVIIGVLTHLLKISIKAISLLCVHDFHTDTGNYALLWVPVAGIVVTGLLVRYVFRRPLEFATEQLKGFITRRQGVLSPALSVEPVIASAITLGCGGSAGGEGPIALAGAAVGSNIGQRLGLTARQTFIMMACGAGAGIAAIFKAPVGGMFFTIEVLSLTLNRKSILLLTSMCVISALTCFALSGFNPAMKFFHPADFEYAHLWPTILLGVMCGLYSRYYLRTGTLTRQLLERVHPDWVRWIVSGSVLAVALFCFPAMYGEGYQLMGRVVNGDPAAVADGATFGMNHNLLLVLAGILMTKGIACYATNSGGGVAGDFAPTFFAGCMVGTLFALGVGSLGWWELPAGDFAVIAMAGVMAGVIRAPLMAIFLAVEMSFTPGLILPVAMCAVVSYFVAGLTKF